MSYSANELKDASIAPLLVSLLQGSLMLGSFGASSYQRHFALWDLAPRLHIGAQNAKKRLLTSHSAWTQVDFE